ncbi:MAG TPA: hypothetical protein VIK93_09905 [Limnochordales bacterium]
MRRWLWVLIVALLLSTVASAALVGASPASASDLADGSGSPVAVSDSGKDGGVGYVTSNNGPSPVHPLPGGR